jgi:hypothetical protein
MSDAQIQMPVPIAEADRDRGGKGALHHMHDPDFGVCWLIQSAEAISLEKHHKWRAGSEWMGDVAPTLVEWVCAFPLSGVTIVPAYLQTRDDDHIANDKERLAYARRRLGLDTESDPEAAAKLLSPRGPLKPTHGWTPHYLPYDRVLLDVSDGHRELFRALRPNIETFRQSAEKVATEALQSAGHFQIREFVLLGGSDILVVGHHRNRYASFFVGDDLTAHPNDLD